MQIWRGISGNWGYIPGNFAIFKKYLAKNPESRYDSAIIAKRNGIVYGSLFL